MRPFIIGVGKAGCKVADLFLNYHQGMLLDSDATTLSFFTRANKLLIGKKLVDGNGTGKNLELGREIFDGERYSIVEKIDEIKKDFDCIFVFSSFGGGTGGAVDVLIEELKNSYLEQVYHVGILPSEEDPEKLIMNFSDCFKDIVRQADAVLPIDNDLLKERMSLRVSLNKINKKVFHYFSNLFEVGEYVSTLGTNVLGVQDVINTLEGVSSLGLGVYEIIRGKSYVDKPELVVALAGEATSRTLFPFEIKESQKALVIVSGPKRYLDFLGSIPARLWLEKTIKSSEVRGGDIPSPKKEDLEVTLVFGGIRKSDRLRYLYQLGKMLKSKEKYSEKIALIYEKMKSAKEKLVQLDKDFEEIYKNLKSIGEEQ